MGTQVFADISVSLDGFIAGPRAGVGNPLGDGGDRLHEWLYGLAGWRAPHGLEDGVHGPDSDLLTETFARTGAHVMGRRMFDEAEEPWGDEPPFHGPVFVLTHEHRDPLVKEGGTAFHFVTDGVEEALRQAADAALGKDVAVAGGADVIRQFLDAELLDELQLHLVPVLFGGGTRLFDDAATPLPRELEIGGVIASPHVTHLRLRPVRG